MPADRATRFSTVLVTDLYALTMLQAYFEEQMSGPRHSACSRRLPDRRNYLLACGLDDVLTFWRRCASISRRLGTWRRSVAFGSIPAVPGGPALHGRRVGRPGRHAGLRERANSRNRRADREAQLVETLVMNQVHVQTVLASKAVRVVEAARGGLSWISGCAGCTASTPGSRPCGRTTSPAWMRRPTWLAVRRMAWSSGTWRTATSGARR